MSKENHKTKSELMRSSIGLMADSYGWCFFRRNRVTQMKESEDGLPTSGQE